MSCIAWLKGFVKYRSSFLGKNFVFLCLLGLSFQLQAYTISSSESPSYDGSYTLTFSSDIWTDFSPYGGGDGDLIEIANGTSTEISVTQQSTSHSVSGRGIGSYKYQLRVCGQYASTSGGCYTTNTITVHVYQLNAVTISALPSTSNTGSINLSWSSVSSAANYKVSERVNGGGWAQVGTYSSNSASFSRSSGSYEYSIKACNSLQCSAETVSSVVKVAITPSNPSSISVPVSALPGDVTVSWGTVSGAHFYRVERRENGGDWEGVNSVYSGYPTTYTANLLPGNYRYRVSACVNTDGFVSCSSGVNSLDIEVRIEALTYSTDEYHYYVGDINDDGLYDLLLTPKAKIILIHGDIITPIVTFPKKESLAYLGQENRFYGPAQVWQVDDALLASLKVYTSSNAEEVLDANQIATIIGESSIDENIPSEFLYESQDLLPLKQGEGELIHITQGSHSVTNGVVSYSIPIDLPPVVNSLSPKLSVNYNSKSNKVNTVGLGWGVSGLSSIYRCKKNYASEGSQVSMSNPKYTMSDRLCLDGQKLILEDGSGSSSNEEYWASGAVYVTERESFVRVHAHDAHSYFVVYRKNGEIAYYGSNVAAFASKAYKPGDYAGIVKNWGVDKVEDRYGNFYSVKYYSDPTTYEFYPLRIDLTPGASIVFHYSNRIDGGESLYDTGSVYRKTVQLDEIETYIDSATSGAGGDETIVKKYSFDYKVSSSTGMPLIDAVTECGFSALGEEQCGRPLLFDWTSSSLDYDTGENYLLRCNGDPRGIFASIPLDINNDGYTDFISLQDHFVASDGLTHVSGDQANQIGRIVHKKLFLGTSGGCYNEIPEFKNYFLQNPVAMLRPIRTKSGIKLAGVRTILRQSEVGTDIAINYNTLNLYEVKFDGLSFESISSYHLPGPVPKDHPYDGVTYHTWPSENASLQVADYNADGLHDFWFSHYVFMQKSTVQGWSLYPETKTISYIHPNQQDKNYGHFHTDWNSDGLVDVLSVAEKNHLFYIDTIQNLGNNPNPPANNPVTRYTASDVWDFEGAFISHGDVQVFYQTYFNVNEMPSPVFSGYGDFNGDGIKDIIFHLADKWMVRLGTGLSFSSEPIDIGFDAATQTNHYFFVKDYDHDGLDDLIYVDDDSASQSWHVLKAGFEGGELAFEKLNIDPFGGRFNDLLSVQNGVEAGNVFRGDFNNDGVIDLYRSGHLGMWWVDAHARYFKGRMPVQDKLQVVTDGFGKQLKFEYSTLTDDDNNGRPFYTPGSDPNDYIYPYSRPNRSLIAVKRLEVSDGVGGYVKTYYNYEGGKVDVRGRGFLGFEKITVSQPDRDLLQVSEYHTEWPFTGSVNSKMESNLAGNLISETQAFYEIHEDNDRYVYPHTLIRKEYYLQDQILSVTKTENQFDEYGNLLRKKIRRGSGVDSSGNVSGVLRTALVQNSVINDPSGWLIGFVERTESATRSGDILGWAIPSQDSDTQVSVSEFIPESGTLDVGVISQFVGTSLENITVVHRESAEGALPGVITGMTNKASKSDGSPITDREEIYKSFSKGIFPAVVENALGHKIFNTYDVGFGVVTSSTDENLISSSILLDAFGRAYASIDKTGSSTEVVEYYCNTGAGPLYSECPENSVYYQITTLRNLSEYRVGSPQSIKFFDLFGRAIRTGEYTLNGDLVFVDTHYGQHGYVSSVSEPRKVGEQVHYTNYSDYTALAEALTVELPDGGSVEIAYDVSDNFLRKLVIQEIADSNSVYSTEMKVYLNALGEVIKAQDDHGTPITYSYDSLGNIERTTVNEDEATTVIVTNDIAGNKIKIVDPASGKIDFIYNGFGELERQVWQEGTSEEKSISYEYDLLGRQVGRTDTKSNGEIAEYYTWVFDTKMKGYLSHIMGGGFTEDYVYDSLGMLDSFTQTIPGLSPRRTAYTYDVFGRLETHQYPNGASVAYEYSANGFHVRTFDISSTGEQSEVWTLGGVTDARGAAHLTRYGNGVVTDNTYDARNGRLVSIRSGLPVIADSSMMSANIQNLVYKWDSLGNLQSRLSQKEDYIGLPQENIFERFNYDSLHRLKESTTTWSGFLAHTVLYDYDNYGNLKENANGTLTYGKINGASAYGVTSSGGRVFHYDSYGNVVAAGTKSIEYDVFNKPIRVGGTRFLYGPNHEKLKQVSGEIVTYYFDNGNYEEVVRPQGNIERVNVGGYLVKEFKSGQVTDLYMHSDHIGSVEAITDSSGRYHSRMRFDAFGNRLDSDSKPEDVNLDVDILNLSWGFTGHDMIDQEGLIHMGGRMYDPEVGRFYSSDLYIQEPLSAQAYNRYGYVTNNPLSFVDPSGYEKVCAKTSAESHNGHVTAKINQYCWDSDNGNILYGDDALDYLRDHYENPQEIPELLYVDGQSVSFQTEYTFGEALSSKSVYIASELWHISEGINPAKAAGVMAVGAVSKPLSRLVGFLGKKLKSIKQSLSGVTKSAAKLCFVEGTLVHTQDGLKPIEEIQVGDLVASKDEFTGETTWKPVSELFRNYDKSILNVTLVNPEGEEELLGVTAEHPFWVEGQGWVDAGELHEGQIISSVDGNVLTVNSIVPDEQLHDTYNFEVADYHTYFVGEQGAWVHNTCLPTVKKAVNSNIGHATERAVERGVFTDAKTAAEQLKNLTSSISKGGFPKGTIMDTARADRVLVPLGNNGMAVYQVGKNGTAKLKTTLIAN